VGLLAEKVGEENSAFFVEVVGVGLLAEKVGAEVSVFFLGGFDAVGARVLGLRAVFAALPASSPADDTVFWIRGFAAVAAFRRKAEGVVRQRPRRPIARALGHRPDILRLVWLLSSSFSLLVRGR
jgi:hypothetical protein